MTKYDEYDNRVVKHNGKQWEVDYEGYIYDIFSFEVKFDGVGYDIKPGEDWYDYVRIKEGISELTSEHIKILEYYQEFYRKNGLAPFRNEVLKTFKKSLNDIWKLFPTKDPFLTIHIMAGLPRPIGDP